MPSDKNIIAIFKKSFFLDELINLISNEKFHIKFFKSLREITEYPNKQKIILIDISIDHKLDEINKIIKSKNNQAKILIFSKKDLNLEDINKEIYSINLPIIFRNFVKILHHVADGNKDISPLAKIGNLIFYPKRSSLIDEKKQAEINLTELENKFLKFLIINRNGSTKNEILQKVWGHNKVLHTHTLESLIYRLRRKIEKNPSKPDFLIQKKNKYFLEV